MLAEKLGGDGRYRRFCCRSQSAAGGKRKRLETTVFSSLFTRIGWRRRRDSDFFSKANKIKDLAPCILVKIVQGHQKGHQKFYEELPIEDL